MCLYFLFLRRHLNKSIKYTFIIKQSHRNILVVSDQCFLVNQCHIYIHKFTPTNFNNDLTKSKVLPVDSTLHVNYKLYRLLTVYMGLIYTASVHRTTRRYNLYNYFIILQYTSPAWKSCLFTCFKWIFLQLIAIYQNSPSGAPPSSRTTRK